MTGEMALTLLGYAIAGAAVGLVFFLALLRSTESLATGGSLGGIIALYGIRIGLVVTAAWFTVQQGALPLLCGLAGFLVARVLVRRRAKRSA